MKTATMMARAKNPLWRLATPVCRSTEEVGEAEGVVLVIPDG